MVSVGASPQLHSSSSILNQSMCMFPPGLYGFPPWSPVSSHCLKISENVCVRIVPRVYFCLTPSVPSTSSGSTVTLTRTKCLLKMNERGFTAVFLNSTAQTEVIVISFTLGVRVRGICVFPLDRHIY